MTKEQLLKEIKEMESTYYQKCIKNGGREGTTLSYGIRSKLNMLIELLEKYFWETYDYQRMT
jgi:hypothetical protein